MVCFIFLINIFQRDLQHIVVMYGEKILPAVVSIDM